MRHPTTQTVTARDAWLSRYAQALTAYAEADRTFGESLAFHIQTRNWDSQTTKARPPSPYLMPTSQADAVATAAWILNSLDQFTSASHTRGLLTAWAQEYEDPKDLIIGIVGLAIIGPTLGIIKRKKDRSHLQIIISEKWKGFSDAKQLATLVQQISQKVVANELRLASGDAYRLHPDTAAWCLEDPLTTIHVTDAATLRDLQKVVYTENLSHATLPRTTVAISPSVNKTLLDSFSMRDLQ